MADVRPGTGAAAAATVAVVVLSAAPPWQFRNWQWVALALAVPVVLVGLRSVRSVRDTTGLLTGAGALGALGWSVAVLLMGGAGVPGMTQPPGAPVLALDAAAALAALLLVRDRPGGAPGEVRGVRLLGLALPALSVAALGFRLGAGDAAGGAAAAVAVLVAGCPCALLLLPRLADGPPRIVVAAAHGPGVLRTAGALHVAQGGTAPVGHAVATAAQARHATLPGVSDPDGDPATGLRGVVSELDGPDRVVAHAALAGPPGWLAAHGVSPTEAAARAAARGVEVWCVAWDGVARGWLEMATAPRAGTRRRRTAQVAALVAAALGAATATTGALGPATAGAVPACVALLVLALRALPLPDGSGPPDRGYQRVVCGFAPDRGTHAIGRPPPMTHSPGR
ncbi:hypothetical protein [Pseudonocardia abyssalis]|uniref:Uncharacterized protein n=1 Tax=Pseudonocardia abyssalis TaxID=2792008 RepID=A0ABS6UW45_9PSEU|nr:hypothetical protein [Pseudonocardia abyssalis]MBW0118699.1 hypothetical protein [Pseudonocardia abyssalis]MBW0136397.1 hypothetical protein [Pseudonocardia abyssalis]